MYIKAKILEFEKKQKKQLKKELQIDICVMRIIASFFVILIHTSNQETSYSIILKIISFFSVPVFIMISGKLMLKKTPKMIPVLKKVLRLLLLMIFWATVFYLYEVFVLKLNITLSLVEYILTEPFHLWYIWAIILLYLLSPILYVFCSNANKKIYLYALFFTFISGTIITCVMRWGVENIFTEIIERTKIPYQLGFIFCFMFGDYCRRNTISLSKFICLTLFLVATLGSIALIPYIPTNLILCFFSPFVIIAAIGVYLYLSQYKYIKSQKIRKIIENISNCSLGIYLMHPLFVNYILNLLKSIKISPTLLPILCAVIVFCISLAFTYIIKKIPLLNKLV